MKKKLLILSLALCTVSLIGAGCTKISDKNTEPVIVVTDQDLTKTSQITVKNASISENGWVVIYNKESGQKGAVLGYAPLAAGTDSRIKIIIDKTKVTPSLVAVLHYDRGQKDVFEFPGSDGPVFKDQKLIEQEFTILNQGSL